MQVVHSEKAPKAIGPYSQAIRTGTLLFCSGQTPIDPISMKVKFLDIESQTRQVIQNLEAVLAAAGLMLSDVVKTTVFLTDMTSFTQMNLVYEACFGMHRPARTTIAAKDLPMNALIEIECIAECKFNKQNENGDNN